jgi:signal transduction histidine kinase
MGELVAGVAHEVRNPLFGISATLDTLDLILAEQSEAAELFHALRLWVQRLTELMQQLLEYGKTWSIDLTEGALEEVIQTAVELCGPLTAERHIAVVTDIEPLPRMLMDATRLIQVFENLIRNSSDHAQKGSIEINARNITMNGRAMIECTIHDSGPGFHPHDLYRVFQPFFTRRRGGTGLGLSIVQRIVEEHGGTVSAENHSNGGALVRILFQPLESKGKA